MTADDPRRSIPGVDRLLREPWCDELVARYGREWVTTCLRTVLTRLRGGQDAIPETGEGIALLVRGELERADTPSLRPVINATGVVLHTNLGRAPLAAEARDAMARAAGYGNVEFDLVTGARGSRYDHCVELLRERTGAEDAVVVNNGAGAVALALTAFSQGLGVAVSHGELVEIGGGFRIPAVIEAAGATLMAVGTTNRTRPADYREAIESGGVGAILKVHRSNFELSGFTEEALLGELVALGAEFGVPVIHDLGSGLLVRPSTVGLPYEPTPAESVAAGTDLVAFSGDKLLGGPQAGVLVGTAEAVSRVKRHPLCRALRTDKVTLAGLEATLALYRDPERARERVPVLRMIGASLESLEARARAIASRTAAPVDVVRGEGLVGGGTFPGVRLPTAQLRIPVGEAADAWAGALRANDPPVIARTKDQEVLLDLRTVQPDEDDTLVEALNAVARTLG